MIVVFSPIAVDELAEIWNWNAQQYGPAHADKYVGHLKRAADNLPGCYTQGKTVSGRPDLRYVLIRLKRRGHGHVVVYRSSDKTLDVLHIFHTAQDWQAKLTDEGANR